MARSPSFARIPLACLLVALGAVGCMQSPQAAMRAESPQGVTGLIAQADCPADGANAPWRALRQELHTQGLDLHLQCAGDQADSAFQLVVLDSVRASQVLRGPLADGEHVQLSLGENASPDVQFNRAWLTQALLRHRVQMKGGDNKQQPSVRLVDLAAR